MTKEDLKLSEEEFYEKFFKETKEELNKLPSTIELLNKKLDECLISFDKSKKDR